MKNLLTKFINKDRVLVLFGTFTIYTPIILYICNNNNIIYNNHKKPYYVLMR